MKPNSKAFHLYFSIIRDITSDDAMAKKITKKILSEIIDSHLHPYDPLDFKKTILYWFEVDEHFNKFN